MSTLKLYPALCAFFGQTFLDSDAESDEASIAQYIATQPPVVRSKVLTQAQNLLATGSLPLDEIGEESNRWFGDESEARTWLQNIIDELSKGELLESSGTELMEVKDSNGSILTEGDSVLVIKDLKVKGGSSDLKRGAVIKNIHLVEDSDVIECRVNGSTLVLKTCFLKKV